MATVAVTPEQDAVTAEIFIAAPPARVFDALTDPTQPPQWWGQKGMYRVTEWLVDLRPGGKWSSVGVGADGAKFWVNGEYLEIDPPRKLSYTWQTSWSGVLKTIVHWELEPQPIHNLQQSGPKKAGTGTMVRIRHEGFGSKHEQALGHAEGWKRVLSWMQAYVEEDATIDSRPAVTPAK